MADDTTSDETGDAAFDESDLVSLGRKLATLDLTDRERAALGALLTDDDVGGFGRFNLVGGIRIGLRTFGRTSGLRAGQQLNQEMEHGFQKPGFPRTF